MYRTTKGGAYSLLFHWSIQLYSYGTTSHTTHIHFAKVASCNMSLMLASTPRYHHSALLTKHIMSLRVTTPCDVTKGARNTHLPQYIKSKCKVHSSSLSDRLISLISSSTFPAPAPAISTVVSTQQYGSATDGPNKLLLQLARRKEEEIETASRNARN